MVKQVLLMFFSVLFIFQPVAADDIKNKTVHRSLCERVAYLANSNRLKSLEVKYTEVNEETAYKLFPKKKVLFYGSAKIWKVDVNGDGLLEIIAETNGQQVLPLVHIADIEKEHVLTFEADNNETNISLIKVDERYYLLGFKYNGSLTKLWEINLDNSFSEVCSFKQSAPKSILVHGTEFKVCNAADKGNISHIKFSSSHAIKRLPNEARFRDKGILPGTAIADIENTGVNKKLIRLSYMVGNGIQCDTLLLAEVDKAGKTIPDIPVNKILFDMPTCVPISNSSNINIFKYDHKTYIDAKGYDGKRDIYIIDNGKLDNVCTFRGIIKNEIN